MSENEEDVERIIELNENLKENNEKLAAKNSAELKSHNIRSFDVVGAIGAGKTLILEKIVEKVSQKYRCFVICGDVTTRIDSERIEKAGARVQQINTGRECALNAYHIFKVISALDLDEIDLLFIENVGNLICPSDFILGADMRIVIVSLPEGAHVIQKHPLLFRMSEIGVINKIDLQPYLDIDVDRMLRDAYAINPNIQMFLTSATTGENLDQLIAYLGLD